MQALAEGQYIKHNQYGFGTVTESDADRTTIDFEAHGTKKFVTSLMTVELAGENPNKPKTRRRKKAAKKAATPATAAAN